MTALQTLAAVIVALFLFHHFVGFGAQSPKDYADTLPRADIRQHLGGPIQSEGVIYGPMGRVSARFVAKMHGEWTGNRGVLRENFTYATGRSQQREWIITLGESGDFTATAPDIVGVATGGQSGATIWMRYRIRLEPDAGGHVLDVTDWLYVMENGAIMNRSEFRKFGFRVGELVATMRPAQE